MIKDPLDPSNSFYTLKLVTYQHISTISNAMLHMHLPVGSSPRASSFKFHTIKHIYVYIHIYQYVQQSIKWLMLHLLFVPTKWISSKSPALASSKTSEITNYTYLHMLKSSHNT